MAATLDDLLKAISRLEKGQGEIRAEIREIRSEMATKDDVDALRSDVEAGFARVDERFDVLEKKLDNVSDVVRSTREDARDVRDDVDAIHKGLVRAVANVPKDLPSQVRAKGERPSKPAKVSRRRR